MKKFLPYLIAIFLLSSCATGGEKRVSTPVLAEPSAEAKLLFSTALASHQAGNFIKSRNEFSQFLANNSQTSLAAPAYFYRADVNFKAGNYAAVIEDLLQIDHSYTSHELRVRIDSLGFRSEQYLDSPLEKTVRWALYLLDDHALAGRLDDQTLELDYLVSAAEAKEVVEQWIQDSLISSASVEALPLENYLGKRSGGYAHYKLALTLVDSGNYSRAEEVLQVYTKAHAKHPNYQAAKHLLDEVITSTGSVSVTIGAILPLSGRYQVFGESVLHGIECALGIFKPCYGPQGVQLLVRDSAGDPEKAKMAVDELHAAGARLIIGPLTTKTVEAAARRAQSLAMPMIVLSQKRGVSNIGNYIFSNTITPASQVDTLVDFAVSQQQLQRFFVLHPKNKIGKIYADLFTEAIQAAGAEMIGVRDYEPHQVDFIEEFKEKKKADEEAQAEAAGENQLADEVAEAEEEAEQEEKLERRVYRVTGEEEKPFDALFIPDSPWVVGYIVPSLAMLGIQDVQLLGTSRWNNPQLVERGGKYVEGAVFTSAFTKLGRHYETQTFIQRFEKSYGIEPTLLEAIGFDSMRMALTAVEDGSIRSSSIQHNLFRMTDFPGVTGQISFNRKGQSHRTLKLLRVSDGEINSLN